MTSADREFCAFQVARFAGLDKWPRNNEAKTALIDAAQAFTSRELLRGFVDSHLRTEGICPKPAVLYRVARETAPKKTQPPIKCMHCYDDGYVLADFLVTWRDGRKFAQRMTAEEVVAFPKDQIKPGLQAIYELPIECECRRGERG